MFKLKGRVARNTSVDLNDSAIIKMAMASWGSYDDKKTDFSPYSDNEMFTAIREFQKDNGLKVDGVINKEGSTQSKIKERLSQNRQAKTSFGDFVKNRRDMIDANTIGADKYFHCKANYEASQRGWGGRLDAKILSGAREAYGFFKGDGIKDIKEDLKANRYGREAAKSGKYKSSKDACSIYRPNGLDVKY